MTMELIVVVTKGEDNIMKEIKEDILKSLKEYSPKVESKYEPVDDPIVYDCCRSKG